MTAVDPLADELAGVRAELPRVDSKCSMLLGVTMAGLAFLSTQVRHGPLVVRLFTGAAGLTLAAATIVLLLAVIRPRLQNTGFRIYAGMSPADVRALFDAGQADAVQRRQAHHLVVLSTITNRKYVGLRYAVDLSAVAALLTAAAILAGVVS
jgi:hypothetical protein